MGKQSAHHTYFPINFRRCRLQIALIILALLLCPQVIWPQSLLAQGDAYQVIAAAVNQARADAGLPPLAVNGLLDQAAQNHVNDMITNYVYGHYGSDGSTVKMRVARTGYSQSPWVSENWVSAGDPASAMRWWMNDYVHRVNILSSNWTEVGIGVGKRGSEMIFVTVFSAGGGSGSNEMIAAAPAAVEEAPPPPSVKIEQVAVPADGLDYTVAGGDTLLAIGLRYGVTWERLAAVNGLTDTSLLQIGQTLRIPGSNSSTTTAAQAIPMPPVETEPYAVQPGDTLFSIAAKRGMTWEEIADVNGFGENTLLQIDQVIDIPKPAPPLEVMYEMIIQNSIAAGAKSAPITLPASEPVSQSASGAETLSATPASVTTASAASASLTPASATAAKVAPSTGVGGPVVLVASPRLKGPLREPVLEGVANIASGDVAPADLAPIEVASAATVSAVTAPAEVAAVATVFTETATAASAESPAEEVVLYTVESGDTIISIAVEYDLDWDELMAINGLGEDSLIQPGQQLRLR